MTSDTPCPSLLSGPRIGFAKYHECMSEGIDLEAFVTRFQERAASVKNRPMPPVEGSERVKFRERMQVDFMDFAMIGDANAALVDGILTLSIDLRPPEA